MLFVVIVIPNVYGACVPSLTQFNFSVDETVTTTITCAASDKNDAGFFVFFNSTNGDDAMDDTANVSFTVPSSSPFIIFPAWKVTANQSPQVNLTGVLYVNDVKISDVRFNTTTTGGLNTLDITDVEISDDIFENQFFGVQGVIKHQGNVVTFARVCGHVEDEAGVIRKARPQDNCEVTDGAGHFEIDIFCDDNLWGCLAGKSFSIEIEATCPINSTTDSYINCVANNEKIGFATKEIGNAFTVDDLGDKMITKKWITENSTPGVYMKNEFGAKTRILNNPSFISPINITWEDFNNTKKRNVSQNGEAFLTAGELASMCLLLNNTFPDEEPIQIVNLNFDDDKLEQFFHPLDAETGVAIRNLPLSHISVKNIDEEGLQEKCTEPFRIPKTIIGGIDWDANFDLVMPRFTQEINGESDEFAIYGKFEGQSFVPIVDIRNVSISAFNENATACTEVNVSMMYNYFGAAEKDFKTEYCFEQTTNDIELGCTVKTINPDIGRNQTINDTFTLPFVKNGGEAEITITVLDIHEDIIGFGDTEPHNTFNITADLGDECRYRGSDDQFLQARQTRALEGINSSAGTFDFKINALDTDVGIVTVTGEGKKGQGGSMNRDINIKCQVEGHPETLNEFKVFATSSFSFTRDMDISLPNGIYTVECTAIDRFFGEDAVRATDNFKKFSDTPSLSFGTKKSIIESLFGGIGKAVGGIAITGKDLIDYLFGIINRFPVISLFVLVGVVLLGREVYQENKKKKKKKKEEK